MEYYFAGSLFGWAVKNAASQYVYANKLACSYFNISADKIAGCLDTDLIPDLGHLHKYIVKSDNIVMSSGKMCVVLKIFDYGGKDKLKAYLVEKRPWVLPDNSPGVICTYIELTNVYFSTFLSQHTRKPLIFTRPSTIFTDREWEVIFLLLCGVKRDFMSEILNIGGFTLRNRIVRCCEKAGIINNETVLTEYCYNNGWDNYVPPFFLKKGYINLF